MRATPRAFRVTVRRAMPETLGIRRLCAAPARLPCRSMSPSRQEVEIRVYHERRLGIGPWLEPVDPFLAYRPEVAVSPELAMGYLTRTPATRTAQHVCDQLIAAARTGALTGSASPVRARSHRHASSSIRVPAPGCGPRWAASRRRRPAACGLRDRREARIRMGVDARGARAAADSGSRGPRA